MALGTALVTGASAGIGEVFARKLAQRNWNLVLVARRAERLAAIAEALRDSYEVACDVCPADLTDPAALGAIQEFLAARELRVDFLVNNAGLGTGGPFARQDYAQVETLLRLNVDAVTRLAHAFLPGMLERRRGVILNVASMAAFQPIPTFAVYAATKSFVLSFTEALAEELRGSGVAVTCLCPGPTATEFNAIAGIDSDFGRFAYQTAEYVVDAALAGCDRGESVVIPGAFNRLHYGAVRLSPRTLAKKVVGLVYSRVLKG